MMSLASPDWKRSLQYIMGIYHPDPVCLVLGLRNNITLLNITNPFCWQHDARTACLLGFLLGVLLVYIAAVSFVSCVPLLVL